MALPILVDKVIERTGLASFMGTWRDSYDFEIHHREKVSISGVLVKT